MLICTWLCIPVIHFLIILLNVQVADVETAIMARKGEVEKLIADMKSANLESLTISPPEETKAFLDGK